MQREQLMIIGAGGAFGAVIRWGLTSIPDQALLAETIAIATLVVNVTGCLILGLLVANPMPERWQWFATTGFAGGLTTMSTFAVEIVDGLSVNIAATLGYIGLSVGVGYGGYLLSSRGKLFEPSTPREQAGQSLGLAIAVIVVLLSINGLIGATDAIFDEGAIVFWALPLAAFAGAVLRAVITKVDAPFKRQVTGVLAANVIGSFLLGVLTGLGDVNTLTGASLSDPTEAIPDGSIGRPLMLVLGTGALGAFTTFSTATEQLERVRSDDGPRRALPILATTVVLVVAAAALGRAFV